MFGDFGEMLKMKELHDNPIKEAGMIFTIIEEIEGEENSWEEEKKEQERKNKMEKLEVERKATTKNKEKKLSLWCYVMISILHLNQYIFIIIKINLCKLAI